jgi:hypothetical protein
MNRDLFYEFLRWLKTSWKFQAGFGLLVVAVSLAVSFVWCEPEYFSRSGALAQLPRFCDRTLVSCGARGAFSDYLPVASA